MLGLAPAGQRTAGQEGFCGPLAEVDGESDAVAVEAGEDDDARGFGVVAKEGAHFSGEENGAGPAMGDADVFQRGVEIADAVFEPAEAIGGLAFADIETMESGRVRSGPPL